MAIETLEDLFHHELSDMYNAEKQLTKALPKMAKAAYDESLKAAFEKHLGETEDQIALLDQVFELCECKPQRIKCEAMEGLKWLADKHRCLIVKSGEGYCRT